MTPTGSGSRDPSHWVALGILNPDAPNFGDRLGLIEFLVSHGATDEEMLAAHRTFGLAGLITDLLRKRPPPWFVYQLTPRGAAAVSSVEPYGSTRWRF